MPYRTERKGGFSIEIDVLPIRYNFSKRNSPISYIVVHDTGNTARTANALNHYRYFNGGDRRASAHYFVDDERAVQTVCDCKRAWHCGDGAGRYGITNDNSIGVEFCVNEGSNRARTLAGLTNLVKFLMNRHNLPKSRVVRHYDASRKECPHSMSADGWKEWFEWHSSL